MQIIGILNVTPDSMACRGEHFMPEAAISRVKDIIAAGADIIDVGAESTRPDSSGITPEEEWDRLRPVLKDIIAIAGEAGVGISLDTRNYKTAERAIESGIHYLNDVSGMSDKNMIDVARGAPNVKVIFMHSVTIPVSRKKECFVDPEVAIIPFLVRWCVRKIDALVDNDIALERLIFDPGVCFGKGVEHSWDIMRNIGVMKKVLPVPICVGHSKKTFLNLDIPPSERGCETLVLSVMPAVLRADYLRVHDVAEHRRALKITEKYWSAAKNCRDISDREALNMDITKV